VQLLNTILRLIVTLTFSWHLLSRFLAPKEPFFKKAAPY
jgi:hypothetical protein